MPKKTLELIKKNLVESLELIKTFSKVTGYKIST